jgi:hypothetical protein
MAVAPQPPDWHLTDVGKGFVALVAALDRLAPLIDFRNSGRSRITCHLENARNR